MSGQKVCFIHQSIEDETITISPQKFGTPEEYFDAYAIFEYLSRREQKRNGETPRGSAYANFSDKYLHCIATDDLTRIKQKHMIKISVDLVKYGRNLCLDCFKDYP